VEADAVHEQVAAHDLCGGYAAGQWSPRAATPAVVVLRRRARIYLNADSRTCSAPT
jgi:hypothetical protein